MSYLIMLPITSLKYCSVGLPGNKSSYAMLDKGVHLWLLQRHPIDAFEGKV